METMNELAGYMSSDQERATHSRMEDSSSDDESLPISSGSKAKLGINSSASATNVLPIVSLKKYDFIPMRLTETERKYLQVLENALEVCEYTDVVDVTFSHTKKSKTSRILESLVDVLSISCGLLVSRFELSVALTLHPRLTILQHILTHRWPTTYRKASSL